MTAVPSCAGQCGLIAVLLGELARARGVSVDVIRVGHGLDVVAAPTTPLPCEHRAQPLTLVSHRDTLEESPA